MIIIALYSIFGNLSFYFKRKELSGQMRMMDQSVVR
jgi:hypothetical protein